MSLFRWNLLLLLVLPMGKKFINFWWWSGPGYEFRTHFHFHYRCGIEDFRRFISISDTVANSAFHPYGVDKSSTNLLGWGEGHLCRVADNTVWSHWQVAPHSFEMNSQRTMRIVLFFNCWPIFTTFGEMTDSESTTFWSDPLDIRIWIRINPEIPIWILDLNRGSVLAVVEVCILWAQSS